MTALLSVKITKPHFSL